MYTSTSRRFVYILCVFVLSIAFPKCNSYPRTSYPGTNNLTLDSNSTNPSSSDGLIILPYAIHVPNSEITLHYGFGLLRHAIDFMDLRSLVIVSQHHADESAQRFGANNLYPHRDGKQSYKYTLGDGIRLFVQNSPGGRLFTWRQLQGIMEGLRMIFVDGRKSYETTFYFWDGPDWHKPLGNGMVLRGNTGPGSYDVSSIISAFR